MKHPTRKHPVPSWLRRLTRWVRDTVDELTRVDEYAALPSYDEVRARAVRGINREVAATPLINRKNH